MTSQLKERRCLKQIEEFNNKSKQIIYTSGGTRGGQLELQN